MGRDARNAKRAEEAFLAREQSSAARCAAGGSSCEPIRCAAGMVPLNYWFAIAALSGQQIGTPIPKH